MLYMADRMSLEKTGQPIIGGRLCAMDYGPVHSEVHDLIKGGNADQKQWSMHFANNSFYVHLATDPGVAALSRYEIGVLGDLSQKYMGYDDWDVASETLKFPEYVQAHDGKNGPPIAISLERLIEAVGRGPDKAKITSNAREKAFFDELFSVKS